MGLLKKFLKDAIVKNNQKVFWIDEISLEEKKYSDLIIDCTKCINQLSSINFETIGIRSSNSYEFVVIFLSAIFSGKKIILLNPNENIAKAKRLLEHFDPSVCFTENHIELICENFKSMQEYKEFQSSNQLSLNQCQAIVYIPTSGTTGDSKIVPLDESQIMANVKALLIHHNLDTCKTFLTPLPLFHVNALFFSLLCTIASGSKIILMKNFDLRRMFSLINKFDVEVCSVIPSILNSILRNINNLEVKSLESLKYFVSAAAPLSVDTVQGIRDQLGKRIIQGYGLSEAVNFSCTIPLDITDQDYVEIMINSKFPSIGVSLVCNEIKLFKDGKFIQDEMIEGEVLIKGENVFSGYLNHYDENLFVDGFFKTGDLGFFKKIENRKYFFISGRLKEIAKINGEAVSLRELDEKLNSLLKLKSDFFYTSFKNEFKDEELALICEVSEDEELILEKTFEDFFKGNSDVGRPKVILYFSSERIRTPSGKAKRWSFSELMKEYYSVRLGYSILHKRIEIK
jgi:long-chain acyl-CoA synthetase